MVQRETDISKRVPQHILLERLNGMWTSYAIQAAVHYNFATLLRERSKTSAQLAQETGTQEAWVYRVLRFLAANDIFVEVTPRTFENTELSTYLRDDIPDSIYAIANMFGSEHHRRSWGLLEESMRTGTPAVELLYGMDIYDYFDMHPEEGVVFDDAMTSLSASADKAIATTYDFSRVGQLVDVGGGRGSLLSTILSHYPSLQGVLFDRPSVIEQVKTSSSTDLPYQLVAGNFFESVPAGADIYMLKWILHNWSDKQCRTILQNCRKAMHSQAVLLVCEQVVFPENNQGSVTKGLDLLMGLEQNGYERTQEEFRALYEASGFHLARIIPTGSIYYIFEGVIV
ncbi:MAG: methyltransferase [Chloroflexi bacterium]|nr:methyltransferase [Chloroflexota bacterium]